jgi:hypothetical protein
MYPTLQGPLKENLTNPETKTMTSKKIHPSELSPFSLEKSCPFQSYDYNYKYD